MRRLAVVLVVLAALGVGTALAVAARGGGSQPAGGAADVQYDDGPDGCTPGFWKNHTDVWSGYSPGDLFNTVFGVNYDASLTLLDALNQGDGGFEALARQASAALLNAGNDDIDYSLNTSEVIALVQQAFATNDPEPAKDQLDEFNNAGCSIDAKGRPIG
jgi:hypothetical protein